MPQLATVRLPARLPHAIAALFALVLVTGVALVAAPRPAHAVNVLLQWTAPGDDSTFGQATEYDLRYTFKPLFPRRFFDADRWLNTPTPGAPGTLESCVVEDLAEETIYYFALRTKDDRGNLSPISNIVTITPTVGADGAEHWKLALSEAVPSPARTNTRLALSLPTKGLVRVEAVDVSGRRVRMLQDGALSAGPHDLVWDLRDDQGQAVRPGVFFVRAEAGGTTFRRRVVVVR